MARFAPRLRHGDVGRVEGLEGGAAEEAERVVDGAAGVVGGENAFGDDGAGPEFAEPAKIFPGDDSATECGADVDERHGTFAGNDDVGERRSAAIQEERSEPTWTREKLRDIGKFREERAAEKLFHAVARVALAESGDGCVDGDDEGVEASLFGAVDGELSDVTTADQIELIPGGAFGGGADVFHGMAGDGGESVDGASVAGRSR